MTTDAEADAVAFMNYLRAGVDDATRQGIVVKRIHLGTVKTAHWNNACKLLIGPNATEGPGGAVFCGIPVTLNSPQPGACFDCEH